MSEEQIEEGTSDLPESEPEETEAEEASE